MKKRLEFTKSDFNQAITEFLERHYPNENFGSKKILITVPWLMSTVDWDMDNENVKIQLETEWTDLDSN